MTPILGPCRTKNATDIATHQTLSDRLIINKISTTLKILPGNPSLVVTHIIKIFSGNQNCYILKSIGKLWQITSSSPMASLPLFYLKAS